MAALDLNGRFDLMMYTYDSKNVIDAKKMEYTTKPYQFTMKPPGFGKLGRVVDGGWVMDYSTYNKALKIPPTIRDDNCPTTGLGAGNIKDPEACEQVANAVGYKFDLWPNNRGGQAYLPGCMTLTKRIFWNSYVNACQDFNGEGNHECAFGGLGPSYRLVCAEKPPLLDPKRNFTLSLVLGSPNDQAQCLHLPSTAETR